jgi:hypothetical protein
MRPVTFCRAVTGGILALILSGGAIPCANLAPAAEDETANTGSNFDNVEILGSSLQGKLTVLRVGSDRTSTNLLSIFAGLKNETARRLEIQVQTLYKDKSGNRLGDGQGSWISLTLKPHAELEYRSASLSEDAVDFLVRIRKIPI